MENKQVKQVYNDQPLGISALGKIGGGYDSLVSMVSRVCPWLPRNGPWLSRCGPWLPRWGPLVPRLSPRLLWCLRCLGWFGWLGWLRWLR